VEGRPENGGQTVYAFPKVCRLRYSFAIPPDDRPEAFSVASDSAPVDARVFLAALLAGAAPGDAGQRLAAVGVFGGEAGRTTLVLPAGCTQPVPGSSWGVFTIACTIPIALFVGWYMYRFRKGRVIEASWLGQ